MDIQLSMTWYISVNAPRTCRGLRVLLPCPHTVPTFLVRVVCRKGCLPYSFLHENTYLCFGGFQSLYEDLCISVMQKLCTSCTSMILVLAACKNPMWMLTAHFICRYSSNTDYYMYVCKDLLIPECISRVAVKLHHPECIFCLLKCQQVGLLPSAPCLLL